ncbi:SRPBCC family protein [Saccharopolyspora sp. NPDC000359]|uniref:SRPBCC family protein n=1 Tax=Saccharopolyspora sp. NPDC000359 TaxID=3154251 RepID=UPI003325700C
MAEQADRGTSSLISELPLDPLRKGAQDLLSALVERAAGSLTDKVEGMAEQLAKSAANGGDGVLKALLGGSKMGLISAPVKAAVGGLKDKVGGALGGVLGGGGGGGGRGGADETKVVNIVEQADVGLPVRVAYDQWTQFEEFPRFTKKVNQVDQSADEEVTWKAQIFLSHRSWKATIIDQVPEDRIVWTSEGDKGTVDGSVTFHALAANLTKILLVIEYRPKGFFEQTANLWRAQGRRVRADFKHIQRHMMTRTILEQDEIEGWRGEIRDGEVVKTHDEAMSEQEGDERGSDREEDEESDRDEREDDRDEYEDDEDSYDEDEDRDEDEDYQDQDEDEYDEQDEDEEPDDERTSGRRERATSGRRR